MSTTDTVVITTRINTALKAKLEALARSTKRSKSFLAAEAIAAYLELNEWQIGELQRGWQNSMRAQVCPKKRVRSGIAGYCSQSEISPPRICSTLFSPARGHPRAHCRGQPDRGEPYCRANSGCGDPLGHVSRPRPPGAGRWHTRARHFGYTVHCTLSG